MLRKIGLSLLMLVSLVEMLPLVNSTAHSIRFEAAQNRRVRRHSRAWWKRHRALMRRRRAARLRRRARALAMRQPNALRQVKSLSAPQTSENHAVFPTTVSLPSAPSTEAKGVGTLPLPSGWSPAVAPAKGEANFRVVESNGSPAGQAALSLVAAASPRASRMSLRDQQRLLAGVSYTDLRRTVIDKMITAGGWVVNDMERNMGGRKVFVVVAQTPAANDGRAPEQIWNFYFTEIDGRVYSLATSAARPSSDRLASDAEKFITSLPPASPGVTRIKFR